MPPVPWVSSLHSRNPLTPDTPFFYPQEGDDAVAYHKSQALGGRLTDIKDIAPLVDYLTKDKWITGQIIFCKSSLSEGDESISDISERRLHYPLGWEAVLLTIRLSRVKS